MIKVIIRDLRGHLLLTVTFLFFLVGGGGVMASQVHNNSGNQGL